MIDHEVIWYFDAENRAVAAEAQAKVAAERRDMLMGQLTRLEKELIVTVAIAREALSALQSGDGPRAGRLAEVVLSRYDNYRANRDYPNLSDLLNVVARCGKVPVD
jgi:hypothetical protein